MTQPHATPEVCPIAAPQAISPAQSPVTSDPFGYVLRQDSSVMPRTDQGPYTTVLPGDMVIDRAMRRAYAVAPDGSYRRLSDDHAYIAIERAKAILMRPTVNYPV